MDETPITEAYQKMYTAMIAKDADGLNEIPDDDFVPVHMTGMRQCCERDLKKICTGAVFERELAVHGADAAESESTVAAWAKKVVR